MEVTLGARRGARSLVPLGGLAHAPGARLPPHDARDDVGAAAARARERGGRGAARRRGRRTGRHGDTGWLGRPRSAPAASPARGHAKPRRVVGPRRTARAASPPRSPVLRLAGRLRTGGHDSSGGCHGDSGGPVLLADGGEAAVISHGDGNCSTDGPDVLRALPLGWIEAWVRAEVHPPVRPGSHRFACPAARRRVTVAPDGESAERVDRRRAALRCAGAPDAARFRERLLAWQRAHARRRRADLRSAGRARRPPAALCRLVIPRRRRTARVALARVARCMAATR